MQINTDFIRLILKSTTLVKHSDLTKIEEANGGGENDGCEDRDGLTFLMTIQLFFPLQSFHMSSSKACTFGCVLPLLTPSKSLLFDVHKKEKYKEVRKSISLSD